MTGFMKKKFTTLENFSFKNYFEHDILGADFMSSVLFASYVSNSMQNTLE
jgi:hypothetical protein